MFGDGKVNPEQMLYTAQMLRDVGVLIFERRCWYNEIEEADGKKFRVTRGCGSYFRWAFGQDSCCPFCGYNWDYSMKFPYTNIDLWPLTINYTGLQSGLSEEERAMYHHIPQEVDA